MRPTNIPFEAEFPGSSAIARGRYHPNENVLDLWWRAEPTDTIGRAYEYYRVPLTVWLELLVEQASGSSVGEFVNRRIKQVYRYAPKS